MRITRKTVRKVAVASSIAGVVFLVFSALFFFTSPIFDYLLVIALTIAVAPPSIADLFHSRWKNRIEKATPEFLRDLATSFKIGMPLQTALENASKRNYGPLTIELKFLVAHMSWSMTFNDALIAFSKRIDLPLIKKAAILVLEAGKHGGELSNIFESTAKYVENVNAWSAKRRMQTLPYVAIFYFSVFIFLFIIIIISRMIFVPLSNLSNGGIPMITPILSSQEARRIFLHTSLLEALFGGLLAGKINEDSFFSGLKHATILAVASGLAFYMFFT